MRILSDIEIDYSGNEFTFKYDELECETTKNDIPVKMYFNVDLVGHARVRSYYPDMPDEYDLAIQLLMVELTDAFYDTDDCSDVYLSKEEIKEYESDLEYEIKQMLE